MPVFQYEALDEKGNEVKAEIEALSSKEAISKIRNKGFFPTKVRAKGAGKKVKAKTAAIINRFITSPFQKYFSKRKLINFPLITIHPLIFND